MNIDVTFKLANSYETAQVETLFDIPVRLPAAAGIGVLVEHLPEDPSGQRSKRPWRGDLVAFWWPNRDESEAQAFEVAVNGEAVMAITHEDGKIVPWLKKNAKAIGANARRFKSEVEGRLQKHVKERLEEAERLAKEANDKVEQDAADFKAMEFEEPQE